MEADMGKLSDAEKQGIIESQMKGYRVARTTPPADSFSQTAGAEDSTPDYKTLRESFLSEEELGEDEDESTGSAETLSETFAGDTFSSESSSSSEADDDDIEIVPVEKESGADPWNRGARPKAVVLSSKDKKIIGSQG
jgi:hypothetical protein